MALDVRLSDRAQDDLFEIGLWIAEQSDREAARAYVDRIEAACFRLGELPQVGTRREALGRGLRSTVFERRATIFFRIDAREVVVARVLHRGRDVGRAFGPRD